MTQDRENWQNVVNMLINLCVPQHARNFLASWATVSFSKTTLYHGFHHLLYHIMQKYSKSCNLQQLWNKRFQFSISIYFVGYHNFLGTRIFYLIYSCKPLWQIKIFNLSCLLCCTFCPLFIATYLRWHMYNLKKTKGHKYLIILITIFIALLPVNGKVKCSKPINPVPVSRAFHVIHFWK